MKKTADKDEFLTVSMALV